MTLRRPQILIFVAAAALMVAAGPAGAARSSSSGGAGAPEIVLPLMFCGDGSQIGIVRFRDEGAQQRGRVIIFSGGPPDTTIAVQGRDVSGPGLPGTITLDGGGGGRLDRSGQFTLRQNPRIDILLDGDVVASTDLGRDCPAG